MPRIFKWPAEKPLPQNFLDELKHTVDNGGVIIYPTTTLYGIGASIHSEEAIGKIFLLKSRPEGMPLSVMSSSKQIKEICSIPDTFKPFMESSDKRLTAILPALEAVPQIMVHNGTLAVRLPCSELTASMINFIGPVTSTSANLHGQPTPPDIETLANRFGDKISLYIDSGKLEGQPTTLVDFTGDEPKIIREGALSREEVERVNER